MSVVPARQSDKIEWCENRVATWTSNAVAMGSSVAEVAAFEAKVETARTALAAAEVARDAAKDATIQLHTAIQALDIAAAGIIKQVRSKAETTGDDNTYALASIPVPATPTPVGAPGIPESLRAALKPSGELELTWTCTHPRGCHGVIYQVYRRVESTGEYTYLGGTGLRKFVDTTVPTGVPMITYQIQATRSTAVGDANYFNVNFGTGASGALTTSVNQSAKATAAKIAA